MGQCSYNISKKEGGTFLHGASHRGFLRLIIMTAWAIREWEKRLKNEEVAENTVTSYLHAVKEAATYFRCKTHETPLKDIGTEELDDYILYLKDERQWKQATIQLHYVALQQYLQFIHFPLKQREDVPKKSIRIEKSQREREEEIQYLTRPEDVQKIRKHLHTVPAETPHKKMTKYRNIALIETLLHTGCRAQEVLTINYEEIEWDDDNKRSGIVKIYNQKTAGRKTKNNHYRYIYIPPSVIQTWNDYFDELRLDHPRRIFAGINHYQTIYSIVQKIGEGCGLPWLSPHQFRHYYATHMIREGIALPLVAQSMGDTIEIASSYVHTDSQYAASIIRERAVSI